MGGGGSSEGQRRGQQRSKSAAAMLWQAGRHMAAHPLLSCCLSPFFRLPPWPSHSSAVVTCTLPPCLSLSLLPCTAFLPPYNFPPRVACASDLPSTVIRTPLEPLRVSVIEREKHWHALQLSLHHEAEGSIHWNLVWKGLLACRAAASSLTHRLTVSQECSPAAPCTSTSATGNQSSHCQHSAAIASIHDYNEAHLAC